MQIYLLFWTIIKRVSIHWSGLGECRIF